MTSAKQENLGNDISEECKKELNVGYSKVMQMMNQVDDDDGIPSSSSSSSSRSNNGDATSTYMGVGGFLVLFFGVFSFFCYRYYLDWEKHVGSMQPKRVKNKPKKTKF